MDQEDCLPFMPDEEVARISVKKMSTCLDINNHEHLDQVPIADIQTTSCQEKEIR